MALRNGLGYGSIGLLIMSFKESCFAVKILSADVGRVWLGTWVLITMFCVIAFSLSAYSDSLLAHQAQIGPTDE